jgi:hypothetical protein
MGRARGSIKGATATASRRAEKRAAALGLPEFEDYAKATAAAESHDWVVVAEELAGHQYLSESAREARSVVLAVVAQQLTPDYRGRWNKDVGLFLAQLYSEPVGEAETMLGPAFWPEGYAAIAERLALLNLEDSASAGHILSTGFIKELCSVGWRNTFLSQLRRQGENDSGTLLARVCARSSYLRELADTVSENPEWAQNLSWDLWFDLWQAHRRAIRQHQPLDLPELLLERLLYKE